MGNGAWGSEGYTINNKNSIKDKKTNILKALDGYERFLYYNSGSLYSWPKRNTDYPYNLYSVTSSQAKTWLGENRSNFPNYGGQLLSASLFDRENVSNLEKVIPNFILDNPDNDPGKVKEKYHDLTIAGVTYDLTSDLGWADFTEDFSNMNKLMREGSY